MLYHQSDSSSFPAFSASSSANLFRSSSSSARRSSSAWCLSFLSSAASYLSSSVTSYLFSFVNWSKTISISFLTPSPCSSSIGHPWTLTEVSFSHYENFATSLTSASLLSPMFRCWSCGRFGRFSGKTLNLF